MNTLALSPVGFKPQFDYGDIPSVLQAEASSLVSSIRVCLKKFNAEALELARQINPIREQMSARQFKAWLTHYFPDAETQIRHWLKVVELAERLPEYVEQMMGWATGALAALSRGSDELVTNILLGQEKLSIKAIKALVTQERLEQNLNSPTESTSPSSTDTIYCVPTTSQADSTSSPTSSNASETQSTSPTASSKSSETAPTSSKTASTSTPSQPSQITIRIAKLAAHRVYLQNQLTPSITGETEERLRYYIKQADLEIEQLCREFDPMKATVTTTVTPSQHSTSENNSTQPQSADANSTDSPFQKLQSQLDAEQQKSTELSSQLEQLRQQLTQLQQASNDNSTQQAQSSDTHSPATDSPFQNLQSQLDAEQQKNRELLNRISQLEQGLTLQQPEAIDTNSPDDELNREAFQNLQSQLDVEQQKNRELLNRISQLEHELTQQQSQTPETHSSDSEFHQLQSQLDAERQKNTELLNQLAELQNQQSQEDLPFLKIFRPQFVPVKVEDLQVNDRIRIIFPDKKTVVDDLILSIDEAEHPVTKWFGAISEKEVEAGWTFERMIGVEKIQSQLSKLLGENRELKSQIAQWSKITTDNPDSPVWQLEKRLMCVESEYQQFKAKAEPVLGCCERLQQKIHHQLQPGTSVEVLFDDKGIHTGNLGTVEQEFECSPGNWWVSFVDPNTQQTCRALFHAYQLYLPPF
ncbi:MAG: hypothetical protein VKK42_16770 [Lyngbya sp.]|nr:hypothetical protein [Lyngbya sp.]